MHRTVRFLLGAAMMTVFTGCKAEQPVKTGLHQVHFEYSRYSGDEMALDAWVDHITESGAEVTVKKRIGSGSSAAEQEGMLKITADQTEELRAILNRYDLEAFSKLPERSYGSSPHRSLRVWDGDRDYDISWNKVFPKTLPPEEDILYFELFNYFNGLLKGNAAWQDVIGDDLEDPREDPKYQVRTVEQFGNLIPLVPGTGNSTNGYGAELDYGDRIWWLEEGFTGSWHACASETVETTADTGVFRVEEDGMTELQVDGTVYSGTLGKVRTYLEPVMAELAAGEEKRTFEIMPLHQDDYTELQIRSYPGPVPEPQFEPIDLYLVKD